MTTEAFKNWLKTVISSPSFTVGRLDTSKSQTICIYSGLSSKPVRPVVGNERGYGEKSIRILVRWGTNFPAAEAKAKEVYDVLGDKKLDIDGVIVCIVRSHSEPVSLGADDKGVYEFAIDVNLFYER